MWSARSRRRGRTTLTPATSGAESQTGALDQPPTTRDANTAVTVTRAQQVGGQAGEPAAGHLFALDGAWCVAATAQTGSITFSTAPEGGHAVRRTRVLAVSDPAHATSAAWARQRTSPSRRPK